jgi:hypothetical protein
MLCQSSFETTRGHKTVPASAPHALLAVYNSNGRGTELAPLDRSGYIAVRDPIGAEFAGWPFSRTQGLEAQCRGKHATSQFETSLPPGAAIVGVGREEDKRVFCFEGTAESDDQFGGR